MTTLLLTGAGLGIGSFISWLIESHPNLFVSADSLKKSDINPRFTLITFLFVSGLALNFYGISAGFFSFPEKISSGVLFSIVCATALFDIRYRLIPNRLLFAGTAGWVCLAIAGMVPLLPSLIAGLSAAVLVLLIRLAGFLFYKKAGMGIGDIKLVFLIGLFLQWEVFWVVYLAVLAGGVCAMAGLLFQMLDRKGRLPFAPFLWIGASLSVLIFSFNEFLLLWI